MEDMCTFHEVYDAETRANLDREFSRVGAISYLDHAGATMYAKCQIEAVHRDLCKDVFGNPHARSPSSQLTADAVDQVRFRVLNFFNTNPDEYSVIFTSGSTGALKLVAESFEFGHHTGNLKGESEGDAVAGESSEDETKGAFSYLVESHTSVVGMRQVAQERGAVVKCVTQKALSQLMTQSCHRTRDLQETHASSNCLFVYPAQCNFSGLKYPLQWVKKVKEGILDSILKVDEYCIDGPVGSEATSNCKNRWYCLLDVASYAATNPLDLSLVQPDFVCLSFYKIFGYPTGLGALLVKKESENVLMKKYFGGGTVLVSLPSEPVHVPRRILHERFEDGTISFLSILALRHGFDALEKLTGGMANVSLHVFGLARYFHHKLVVLHHANGRPVGKVYCDTDFENPALQGGTVNFNLLRANGEYVGFVEVDHMAAVHDIHFRTGCFCNTGACSRHLGLSSRDMQHQFELGHVCGDDRDLVDGKTTGSIRVSFGYMSRKEDADRLLAMISSCFVEGNSVQKIPSWWLAHKRRLDGFFPLEEPEQEATDAQFKAEPFPDNLKPCGTGGSVAADAKVVLTGICVYPVKSCGAFKPPCWTIGQWGLTFDRQWMVVTARGVCLTQKMEPKLCLLKPTVDLDQNLLWLNCKGMEALAVPLQVPSTTRGLRGASVCSSKVCGVNVAGLDCGDVAAEWLNRALEREGLRLFHHWGRGSEQGNDAGRLNLSLANEAQYLLVNEASVHHLVVAVEEKDSDQSYKEGFTERFRANLVVDGARKFSEDDWTSVRIRNVTFQNVGPCTRCRMICVDQESGERTKEPLLTLFGLRGKKATFGIHLMHSVHDVPFDQSIAVGDEVHVL